MTKHHRYDRFLALCLLMMAAVNFVIALQGNLVAALFSPLFLFLFVRQMVHIHRAHHVRHDPGAVRDPWRHYSRYY